MADSGTTTDDGPVAAGCTGYDEDPAPGNYGYCGSCGYPFHRHPDELIPPDPRDPVAARPVSS